MLGLSVKLESVGYLMKEYPRLNSESKRDIHTVKSKAGKLFHEDNVISVCVFDEAGNAHLYLKKTPNGVYREEL